MVTKEKQRNGELGSTVIKIMENPELSEQQKNEKITEILIEAADRVGRAKKSLIELALRDLWEDYLQLSTITDLADYLPEKKKAKVLKEVVNVSMNTLRKYYKWGDSYKLVEVAVHAAQRIHGEEGIEILEKLGNEFLSRNWTWSASLVAEALGGRGEKEKADELQRKIDFRKVALGLNEKKEFQPYPWFYCSPRN